MDGLKEDAEILFVLTTNRPEQLEAALASRSGPIDQAIEFPLPNDTGRRKLVALYSQGITLPEFTYIDDIIEGVVRVMVRIPERDPDWNSERPNPGTSSAPWRVYNIGNNTAVELERYIATLEQCLGRTAERRLLPMQPGDVPDTFADFSALEADVGYAPSTPIETGVRNFVEWYREYYEV